MIKIIEKKNSILCVYIKRALCHHVVAYSIVIGTDVFSVKYRQPDN
jgi:hypothetical protein